MPKAKPDQVIVHRIDLQPSVKDLGEGLVLGNAVGNALSGAGALIGGVGTAIGGILRPFGGAVTALAALWIADRTFDEVLDAAAKHGDAIKRSREENYASEYGEGYTNVVTWLGNLYAVGGLSHVEEVTRTFRNISGPTNWGMRDSTMMSDLTMRSFNYGDYEFSGFNQLTQNGEEEVGPAPNFLWVKLAQFLHMLFPPGFDNSVDNIEKNWEGSMVEAFKAFYPFTNFGPDFYYYDGGSPFEGKVSWKGAKSGDTPSSAQSAAGSVWNAIGELVSF